MREDRVRIEVDDHVAVVTLARPEKHNALDEAMFDAIAEAAAEVGATPGVRAVVLHGEGPSFCSGLDLASLMTGPVAVDEVLLTREDGQRANRAQRTATDWIDLPVPVVAALHGVVYGGGLQLALGADVRIAAPDARLSVMESRWGLVPDMGITSTLPRLVRADVAKELTYTGRIVSGEEAAALGLVTRVDDDPLAAARALARRDRRALPGRGARREAALRHGLARARRGRPAARGRAADGADRRAEPARGGDRRRDEAARGVHRPRGLAQPLGRPVRPGRRAIVGPLRLPLGALPLGEPPAQVRRLVGPALVRVLVGVAVAAGGLLALLALAAQLAEPEVLRRGLLAVHGMPCSRRGRTAPPGSRPGERSAEQALACGRAVPAP